jgi:DNA-binding LytR/AlgR family response regulator
VDGGAALSGKTPWHAPYQEAAGWLRGLIVAVAVGLFLAFSGAFGTIEAPFVLRLAYWLPLMTLGAVWGAFVSGVLFGRDRWAPHPWIAAIAASVVMAAPFTLVVWLASNAVFGIAFDTNDLPGLFVPVLVVSLAMTSLNTLLERRRVVAAEAPGPPKFLERLPLKLRGAEVWAVEAEDHYLRLHTSKGQDLILMRLADAIAELDGIEGMQVHRSWWVAREAITEAKRGDGRATLTLKDGAEVPVSRTYASELRARRWI